MLGFVHEAAAAWVVNKSSAKADSTEDAVSLYVAGSESALGTLANISLASSNGTSL